MFVLPFSIDPETYSIFVVLDDENLSRIKEYDPAEVVTKLFGPPWTGRKVKDIVITYATEAERVQVLALCEQGKQRRHGAGNLRSEYGLF
jgi:hypothetical protein